MIKNYTTADVEFLKFNTIDQGNTHLSFSEGIRANRIFLIDVKQPEIRGRHAHKKCSQWFGILRGSAVIYCTDGINHLSINITDTDNFLFIPPGIWAEQTYSLNTKALVFCDLIFDEADYIRNWDDFVAYKKRAIAAHE